MSGLRPTRRGAALAVASVACCGAGTQLGYGELVVIGIGAALVLVAAGLRLVRPVPVRVVRDIAPLRVSRGDPAIVVLTCHNEGRWRSPALRVADRCGPETVVVDVSRLRPGHSFRTVYRLPTRRRGLVEVGPMHCTVTDLFGLMRREQVGAASVTVQVRPRVVTLPATPAGSGCDLDGPAGDRAPSGPVMSHTLRPYVSGDDPRHIHWRTTARTNALTVRRMVDTDRWHTAVVLDTRRSSYASEEDFEIAVDAAASVAVTAATHRRAVTVFAGRRHLSTVDGGHRASVDQILDQLSLVSMVADEQTPAMLAAAVATRGRGALVVVTGVAGTADPQVFAAVRRNFDRTVLVRVGPEPPPGPPLPVVVVDGADLGQLGQAWRARVGS